MSKFRDGAPRPGAEMTPTRGGDGKAAEERFADISRYLVQRTPEIDGIIAVTEAIEVVGQRHPQYREAVFR